MPTLAGLLCGIAALVTIVYAPPPASAQPRRDPAAAEALFSEGQALVEKGDYERACPKLAESYRLDPATGALYALALCHERQGLFASAWVELMDVASRANAEGYTERERAARERAEALRNRLSFLVVRVAPETAALPGLVVTRDGIALGTAAWGSAIPVDPGRHLVVAEAPGYKAWSTTVSIGAGPVTESVEVPVLAAVPPRAGAAPDDRAASSAPPLEVLGLTMTPLRIAGIAAGAAGVASLGLATYGSFRAVVKNEDSEENCPEGQCNDQGERDRMAAVEAANLATVSAIAGGTLLAAGAVLFAFGAPADGRTALVVSPTKISLHGSF
jgi:hypothetical protein